MVFLLFVIGLEFSIDRLWAMRRYVLGVGSIQVVASALAIMASAHLRSAPNRRRPGGRPCARAVVDRAIVTQVLLDVRRFARPVGQVSLGVLLFEI